MTGWLRSIGMTLALGASACTSLPYGVPCFEAMAPTTGTFVGLRTLAPGKPLKLMVVHGMCTQDSHWVDKWKAAMKRAFGSDGVMRSRGPVGMIDVERYDFEDHGRLIEATFVLWSPATKAAKQTLEYDSGTAFPYKRAKINEMAKSELINDCFSDPVIYSGSRAEGTVGAGIRADMAAIVCGFLGGRRGADACTGGDDVPDRAFITESLGSKILFDAVDRVVKRENPASAPQRAALEKTRAIYMLANQLPLLKLAEAPAGVAALQAVESDLRWFGPSPQPGGGVTIMAADGAPAFQVVAFTDPNDVFSYRLTYDALRETPARVALFNVIVSNAPTYLGLAENPYPAHTGYWKNPRVPPLVLQGGTAATAPPPRQCQRH